MDPAESKLDNAHRHPWELSRRGRLLDLLRRLGPLGDVADVGAGDRFFTRELRAAATGRVYAIDTSYEKTGVIDGCHLARTTAALPDAALDCVVMMDVLEHVEEEGTLLLDVCRALRPNGTLLVTVPAFQPLFSAHDAFLKHLRRYNMRHLRGVLEGHGFEVERAFYFYAALTAARLLEVVRERIAGPARRQGAGSWPFGARHPVTVAVRYWLDWDYRCCVALARLGLAIPGLSLCAVCRKTSA